MNLLTPLRRLRAWIRRKVCRLYTRLRARPTYLLDTSVFLALSKGQIGQFCPPPLISPFCFYELLCHLDEDNFQRRKGNLLKCLATTILDEPAATFNSFFGVDPRPPEDRFSAGDLARAILGCLRESNTLSEFYAQPVMDPIGNYRLVSACARRARLRLDDQASDYQNFVSQIIGHLRNGNVDLGSDDSCNSAIMSLVHGDEIILKQRGARDPALKDIADWKYLFYGYVFERAVWYVARGAIETARNDYEDGLMVMHLRLTNPTTMIVNDVNTLHAVRRTFARLERLGFGDTYELAPERVVTSSDVSFRSLFVESKL